MIPPSQTRASPRDRRSGSKRFLPRNTNGSGSTRIASNCRTSVRWHLSVKAFHEKAGRSQVGSFIFSLDKVFSPAEWPLSPCFHPHSRGAIRFARCMLGVLVSAGAAICLAPCGSALEEWNLGQAINAVTGTRLWACLFSLPGTVLPFTQLRLLWWSCYCAVVRILLRSPTGDATTPPAFSRSPRWLASSRFLRHARPASGPSA